MHVSRIYKLPLSCNLCINLQILFYKVNIIQYKKWIDLIHVIYAICCRIYSNVGVEVGLVGCIEALEITIKDFTKQYNLVYPGSSDIITGKGIGKSWI